MFTNKDVLSGKNVDFDYLNQHKFKHEENIKICGFHSLCTLDCEIYPDLVRVFYSNMEASDKPGFVLKSYVKGKEIVLTPSDLNRLLNVSNCGIAFFQGSWCRDRDLSNERVSRRIYKVSSIPDNYVEDPLDYKLLDFEMKLLQKIVFSVVNVRVGGRARPTRHDKFFMGCILEQTEVNVAYYMLYYMSVCCKAKALPYGMALTKIFQGLGIDLTNERSERPNSLYDGINKHSIKIMGYYWDDHNEVFRTKHNKDGYFEIREVGLRISLKRFPTADDLANAGIPRSQDSSSSEDATDTEENTEAAPSQSAGLGVLNSRVTLLSNEVRELRADVGHLDQRMTAFRLEVDGKFENIMSKIDLMFEYVKAKLTPSCASSPKTD